MNKINESIEKNLKKKNKELRYAQDIRNRYISEVIRVLIPNIKEIKAQGITGNLIGKGTPTDNLIEFDEQSSSQVGQE